MPKLTAPAALLARVESLYGQAKAGQWENVWLALAGERELAGSCSRYVRTGSGWTFLHQAAYAGDTAAVRGLVRLGGSLSATSKQNQTPRDVAVARGHRGLAALLEEAEQGAGELWEPSAEADTFPSSRAWRQGSERRAWRRLRVGHAGGTILIPSGARYFVDSFERVLVGWHGTYDPPSGMDGESLL